MNQDKKLIDEIIEEAIKGRSKAFAPYSNFFVGAALRMKDGSIFRGANIENASYGLCNCAERTALFSAYANGYRKDDIEVMCVVGATEKPISPCGACRQVMNELLLKDTCIVLTNMKKEIKITTIKELLPYSFDEVEND